MDLHELLSRSQAPRRLVLLARGLAADPLVLNSRFSAASAYGPRFVRTEDASLGMGSGKQQMYSSFANWFRAASLRG